jgi:hypothetical protein
MKRSYLILSLLLLLAVSATNVMAQQRGDKDGDGVPDSRDQCPDIAGSPNNNGCPVLEIAPPQPPPPADSDGDGLPDSNDQCPNQAGPRENGGCPVVVIATPVPPPSNDVPDQPPADPNPPGESAGNPGDVAPVPLQPTVPPIVPTSLPLPPQFQPPLLPVEGCYVTAASNNNINVRQMPDLSAAVLGWLSPGVVYEAMGYVVNGDQAWFMLSTYESYAGDMGYSARSVLLTTGDCPQIAPPLVLDEQPTWERPIVRRSVDGFATSEDNGTASYEPDQADIDAMTADCGEDNWGYVFDDDELTGYYCLDDDTASSEPTVKDFEHSSPTGGNTSGGTRLADGDCNENGIRDGDELLPPDCLKANSSN